MENENTDVTGRTPQLAANSMLSVYQQKFETFKTLKSNRREGANPSAAQLIMSQRDPNRIIETYDDSVESSSYVLGDSNGDFSDTDDEVKVESPEMPAKTGQPVVEFESPLQYSAVDEQDAGTGQDEEDEDEESSDDDYSEEDDGEDDDDDDDDGDEEDDDEDEEDDEVYESSVEEYSPSIMPSGAQPSTEATTGVAKWELNLISPIIPDLINSDDEKEELEDNSLREVSQASVASSTSPITYTKVHIAPHGEPLAPKNSPLMLQNIAPSPVSYACPFYDTLEYNPNCPTNESLLLTILNYEMDNLDIKPVSVPVKKRVGRLFYRLLHAGGMTSNEYLERYPWERYYDLSEQYQENEQDEVDDREEFNFDMIPLSAKINPYTAKSDSIRNKKPHTFIASSSKE
ncbi:hypothetical protein OGAPHI_006504 [Ogataea philodendri]|uniref:Uncharacterized protein n=1 Tax=Ogataea philodendri TaxID=1378263 RepID=A0A9P8T0Y7_9ASCO|nr:uncharacterized protein OGAPHI_006504 [Ogataea philodendri]KAH3661654.1 hypothetical protein OGAPHI_006504 [Ogataea philodendri]